MNFNQKLAQYVLGNLPTSNIPDLALTAINEGFESESLLILAGFLKHENNHEIIYYFNKALAELNITLKNEKEATIQLISFYAYEILNNRIEPYEGLNMIVGRILHKTNLWKEIKKYPYDCVGFENLYALYWQLEEIENNEIIVDKIQKFDLILKIEQDIKEELKNWMKNTEGVKLSRHRNI